MKEHSESAIITWRKVTTPKGEMIMSNNAVIKAYLVFLNQTSRGMNMKVKKEKNITVVGKFDSTIANEEKS